MKPHIMLPPVEMSPEALRQLPEYSCTLPTGTTIGKRWCCNRNAYRPGPLSGLRHPDWWVGEYFDIGSQTQVGIRWRPVRVRTEGGAS